MKDQEKKQPNETTADRVSKNLDQVDDAVEHIAMGEGDSILDEVQSLTWALVDEMIDEPQIHRLEKLILGDASARETYIKCIQLHVDLIWYFAGKKGDGDSPFPLPAELQQLMQSKAHEKRRDGPAASFRKTSGRMLLGWRRLANQWAFALKILWNRPYVRAVR